MYGLESCKNSATVEMSDHFRCKRNTCQRRCLQFTDWQLHVSWNTRILRLNLNSLLFTPNLVLLSNALIRRVLEVLAVIFIRYHYKQLLLHVADDTHTTAPQISINCANYFAWFKGIAISDYTRQYWNCLAGRCNDCESRTICEPMIESIDGLYVIPAGLSTLLQSNINVRLVTRITIIMFVCFYVDWFEWTIVSTDDLMTVMNDIHEDKRYSCVHVGSCNLQVAGNQGRHTYRQLNVLCNKVWQ